MDISTLKSRESEKGFTLVELAVVMIIIGLLIGGILKGQELITNARVTSTASQLEAIGAAYNGFRDKYNAIPGDMSSATTRIAGCADACDDGDGNGLVDVNVGADAGNDEGVFFFGQLLFADFITGMTGTDNGANPEFGITNPTAPIGGGFTAGDSRNGVETDLDQGLRPGVHVVLAGRADVAAAAGDGVLSTSQAANIDRRLDDGVPTTGILVGDTGCDDGGAPAEYDEADQTVGCTVAYRM